jgi:hypothetical protein
VYKYEAKNGMLTTDTMAVEGNNEVKEHVNKKGENKGQKN